MYRTELIHEALKARENAYCPYSHYAVGAALLGKSGSVYRGCNVENASYGAANCAERTAVYSAVAAGEKKFVAIAIVGGLEGAQPPFSQFAFPCGVCRQVLWELGGEKLLVIVARDEDNYQEYTLGELLPEAFGPEKL
ncbi:cytidine deaminase [Zongyangia hominis]|uniref:Cytidine deaminase n=1 Tax=Zongyangia hominis TaxID=2763677 RepID=A0A926IAP2_9FIRM|nr:cytidine deaminase [Zongyangia hominis]MBC8569418.1 cytidine deaminase [Zongyangia hominis]